MYIFLDIYIPGTPMDDQTARLFTNGGSQAVRLPARFRFEGATEVYIRRDAVTGDVVLSRQPHPREWSGFFAVRDAAGPLEDPSAGRPGNTPLAPRALADAP